MDTGFDAYGRPFPKAKYHRPILTCDAIVEKLVNNKRHILLITRGKPPQIGRLAFPGGHLDYNEDPKDCCLRELKEETGLIGKTIELVNVKGHPLRDQRGHYVTIVYKVTVDPDAEPNAGDDAATAGWYSLGDIILSGAEAFAFDHYDILDEYYKSTKETLQQSNL